jgi:secreted PhoX family phosphatase
VEGSFVSEPRDPGRMKRRTFLGWSAASTLQLYVQGCRQVVRTESLAELAAPLEELGFGPLIDAGAGLLDLPKGFSYRVIQRDGVEMADGHSMPPQPDGMACFAGADGRWILLRNHELGDRFFLDRYGFSTSMYQNGIPPLPNVDPSCYGGVSRVVLDPAVLTTELRASRGVMSRAVVDSRMVLAGTDSNCSGGVVPEGWISCEESSLAGHGYAYLVRPESVGLTEPERITSWGRFHREAIAHDPETGIVYMTEDRRDGCLYRHVPHDPGNHLGPGRVQALRIPGVAFTHRADSGGLATSKTDVLSARGGWPKHQRWSVDWVDVEDSEATRTTCREQALDQGATSFCRSEGIARSGSDIWFSASTAGPVQGGQVFRYTPGAERAGGGTLVLEYEVRDRTVLSSPDNLTVAPWGDLVLAEDNYDGEDGAEHQHIRAMTSKGEIYNIARNRNNQVSDGSPGAEFTGVCFSPDGAVLFANLQRPEQLTVAITGPWENLRKE